MMFLYSKFRTLSHRLGFYLCLLMALCFSVAHGLAPALAQPAPGERPAYEQQFFNYLHNQKFSLVLGESRGACAYSIDPSDVYAQGDQRFVLAKINQGNAGTACRGVLDFNVLHADCQAKKLYEFQRKTEGDIRTRGWDHFELSLSRSTRPGERAVRVSSTDLAGQVCGLTARSNGNTPEAPTGY